MPDELKIGYTSPMFRDRWDVTDEPPRKRNPIGFVHFGEPEEEPRSYLDEYIQFKLDMDIDDDELLVGFTATNDGII